MLNDRLQRVSDLITESETQQNNINNIDKLDEPTLSTKQTINESTNELNVDMITEFKRRKYELSQQKKREDAIKINIAEDRLSATFNISSAIDRTKPITMMEISDKIKASGITTGISTDRIEKFINFPMYNTDIVFAQGEDRIDGVDGYFTPQFDFTKKQNKKVDENENSKLDFYSALNDTISASRGQLLGIITPNIERKDGIDIFGNVLRGKNSRPTLIKFGDNVGVDEKHQVIAIEPGEIKWSDGQLWINKVLRIPRVDIKSGNIKFGGSVIVDGDVLDGFTIDCEGDIYVKGKVGSCRLKSGGNVMVDQGIHGRRFDACVINAFGDVSSKFIEQATIDCYGDVTTNELINTKAFVRGNVEIISGAGKIIGGECTCCGNIWANIIGNSANVLTKLNLIGKNILLQEMDDLDAEIQRMMITISEISRFSKARILRTRLLSERREIQEDTNLRIANVEQEVKSKEYRHSLLKNIADKHDYTGEVMARIQAFEEVRIVIAGVEHITTQRYRIARFALVEDEITKFSIG